MFTAESAEALLVEGINTFYAELGVVKTVRFLQFLEAFSGDFVRELEAKSEKLGRKEVLKLLEQARETRQDLWKKLGLA